MLWRPLANSSLSIFPSLLRSSFSNKLSSLVSDSASSGFEDIIGIPELRTPPSQLTLILLNPLPPTTLRRPGSSRD